MKCGQHFDLYSIIKAQQEGSPFIGSISGVIYSSLVSFVSRQNWHLSPLTCLKAEAELLKESLLNIQEQHMQ